MTAVRLRHTSSTTFSGLTACIRVEIIALACLRSCMLVGWIGVRSLEEAHDFEQSLPYMIVVSQHSCVKANKRKARGRHRVCRGRLHSFACPCVSPFGKNVHRAMSACQCIAEQMWVDESPPQSLGQHPPQTALRSGRCPQRIYILAPGHSEHSSDDALVSLQIAMMRTGALLSPCVLISRACHLVAVITSFSVVCRPLDDREDTCIRRVYG